MNLRTSGGTRYRSRLPHISAWAITAVACYTIGRLITLLRITIQANTHGALSPELSKLSR